MKADWPPIIDRARVPRWCRFRDGVLTFLAWALMIGLLQPLLIIAWHAAEVTLGLRDALPPVHAKLFFQELLPFFKLIVLFSLSLSILAISRREYLKSVADARNPPPPLPPEQQAQNFSLHPGQMEMLQVQRISLVQIDNGSITKIESPGPGPGAST
ncbi:poly-beta-1,6-N-acetyl-D-glucosamine biosynthesis protein PgaD [Microbulbifer sp. HZ11]|uniref:poly-beta-1,6-N-acetyl-D-glucosamine biosynthesis protein PgaD n=1 Tax=Microbulbifer sp. HZ11 TaxID=1453501 RepID=UPI0005B8D2B7|nr:poly-beta-1,6-N-acetyl-D-glucosamine biosynthesis protein PgaD [Microbulbifer sp. HZ11]